MLHLRCLAGFRIRLCILLPLGWSIFWLEVPSMTVTQSNWQTNEQTTDYIGIINVRCLFKAHCFCINRALFFMVFFFFFWITKYEVYSFKIQWKFSAFQHLMQLKQSKFKPDENFPRFPSFRFCPIPKIENSGISEFFFLLQILKEVVT